MLNSVARDTVAAVNCRQAPTRGRSQILKRISFGLEDIFVFHVHSVLVNF